MITLCLYSVEETAIGIASTTWYLLKTFIHADVLSGTFVIVMYSHKVPVILSGPSWRTLIMRRNHQGGGHHLEDAFKFQLIV